MSAHDISSKAEDYLRAIYEIAARKRVVRIKDLSQELEVKPPTVVEMMKKLNAKRLVIYEKYDGVILTDYGTEIAEIIEKKHETFMDFLEILLVPNGIAVKDAHILEHKLHPKTILQFSRFVDFMTDYSVHPLAMQSWLDEFKRYCDRKIKEENNITLKPLIYHKN